VVAADEGDRHARLDDAGERGEHAVVLAQDDGAVLEPEVEEVAIDQQPRRSIGRVGEEGAEGALGRARHRA
jgi:hypothetical protein